MIKKNSDIRLICLFFALTFFSLYALTKLQFGRSTSTQNNVYTIRFEWFGMDSESMERMITIPLESRLTNIKSIDSITSSVSMGVSLSTVQFSSGTKEREMYPLIMQQVDALYPLLPGSVQKPVVYPAKDDDKPVYVAFMGMSDNSKHFDRSYVDVFVKPQFESIEGVAEVEIFGGSQKEIRFEIDNGRLGSIGADTQDLALSIQDAHSIPFSVRLQEGGMYIPLRFQGNKEKTVNGILDYTLSTISHNGQSIPLSMIADVSFSTRKGDEISRVNGREGIVISIKKLANASEIKIGKECANVISGIEKQGIQTHTILDAGTQTMSLMSEIITSIIAGSILAVIVLPFFFSDFNSLLTIVLALPIASLWTLAFLSINDIKIDQYILTGMCVSSGLTLDPVIMIAESYRNRSNALHKATSINRLLPSLISSVATSVLVLIPLMYLEESVPGVRHIAYTISLMLIFSFLFAVFFAPVLLDSATDIHVNRSLIYIHKKILQKGLLFLAYKADKRLMHHETKLCSLFVTLCFLTPIAFISSGKNFSVFESNDSIEFSLEWESERSKEYIDEISSDAISDISDLPGVILVKTIARRGNLEGYAVIDKKITSSFNVAQQIYKIGRIGDGSFIYVPLLSVNDSPSVAIQIAVVGDDSLQCQLCAHDVASYISSFSQITQTVLNFKDREKVIEFIPNYGLLARSGISVEKIARDLRVFVFGVVVDKIIRDSHEIDVVLGGLHNEELLSTLNNITITNEASNSKENDNSEYYGLEDLGVFRTGLIVGKISRINGRRAAWITTHIAAKNNSLALAKLEDIISTYQLPKGYAVYFPEWYQKESEKLSLVFMYFCLCALLIMLLLIALTEEYVHGALIALIAPVSASIPLLVAICTTSSLVISDLVGLIILSGVAVNNGIFIHDSYKLNSPRRTIRNHFNSIVFSSITSILAALPLALFSNDTFSSRLAMVIVLGTCASLIISFFMFPSVLRMSDLILSRRSRNE